MASSQRPAPPSTSIYAVFIVALFFQSARPIFKLMSRHHRCVNVCNRWNVNANVDALLSNWMTSMMSRFPFKKKKFSNQHPSINKFSDGHFRVISTIIGWTMKTLSRALDSTGNSIQLQTKCDGWKQSNQLEGPKSGGRRGGGNAEFRSPVGPLETRPIHEYFIRTSPWKMYGRDRDYQ